MARKLGLEFEPLSKGDQAILFTASGAQMPILSLANLEIIIGGRVIKTSARIIENLSHDLILGCATLKACGAMIDFGKRTITFQDTDAEVDIDTTRNSIFSNCVTFARVNKSVRVPAFSECTFQISVGNRFNNRSVLIEPCSQFQFRPFILAKSFSHCKNGIAAGRLLNPCPRDVMLFRGRKVGVIQDLSTVASATIYKPEINSSDKEKAGSLFKVTDSKDVLDAFAKNYKLKINSQLDDHQRYQLLQVLYLNRNNFARDLSEMGTYPDYELRLEPVSNRRAFKRQYRLAQEDALECERQIQLLLKNQIIEPSTCVDFNSPLFLVGKKDGSKRMVIDLRGINSLLKPFLVHLPKIPELLEEATLVQGDKLYLSSLDLFSGFFVIKLHKNSRHYTSFTSPATGERYQYQRVPFGLHASPAAMTLCLCLSNVLRGVLWSRFLCYMDDLLCRSGSWEGHLQDLSDLFALLFKNNLRCNPTKCEFGFTSLDFLGFTISQQGIGISKKKTQIIEKIAPPTNRKSLQRILGLLTFFRRHVRAFAQKTANMRKLLNSDDDYKWTEKCDQELSYLKARLLSDEVLKPIDPSKEVFIQVDASTEGTGYVVMQRYDGRFCPNYFGGQR